jgi:hypothetical protein
VRALLLALALMLLGTGCATAVAGHAVRGETPAEATVPEREREFLARLDLTYSHGHGPADRALALGWNTCTNVHMAGSSPEWNTAVLSRNNLLNAEQAANLVTAALTTLCPDGAVHLPR